MEYVALRSVRFVATNCVEQGVSSGLHAVLSKLRLTSIQVRRLVVCCEERKSQREWNRWRLTMACEATAHKWRRRKGIGGKTPSR